MLSRKLTSTGIALWMAMLIGGCVRSTQPILLDSQVITDNSLVGKWVNHDKDNLQTIVVGTPDKDNLCDVVYTSKDDKGDHPIHVLARLGNLGHRLIAEVRPAPPAEGSADSSPLVMPLYTFVVVEKGNDQVTLSMLDVDWTNQYIKDHPQELPTIKSGENDVILNTPTDALQDFLKKHLGDDGALKTKTVFVRDAAAPAK